MSEHPLAFILRDAFATASYLDPIQGCVVVKTVDRRTHIGQISWVSEDGKAFSMLRVWESLRVGGKITEYSRAEATRHFSTEHVVEIYYNEAGA